MENFYKNPNAYDRRVHIANYLLIAMCFGMAFTQDGGIKWVIAGVVPALPEALLIANKVYAKRNERRVRRYRIISPQTGLAESHFGEEL